MQVAADILVTSYCCEEKIRVRRQLVQTAAPKRISVTSEDGKKILRRYFGGIPGRGRVIGCVDPSFADELQKRQHVFCTLSWAVAMVLVLDLYADNWPTLLPIQPIRLLADLFEETLDVIEILRIVLARFTFFDQPIGQAPIANFAVCPRSDTNPHVHAMFGTQLDKFAQAALSPPIELAFNFFMMDPEDIGRDDLYATGFHF